MKRMRLNSYLVIFLATLSLISVGFASWVASNGMTASTSGMIVVEDVLKVNEYITCSSEGITKFSFFKTGFVNNGEIALFEENGNTFTSGIITTKLEVKIANCKSKFSDCNTLEIDLNLMADQIALFNSGSDSKITVSVNDNRFVIDDDYITVSPFVTIMYLDDFQSLEDTIEITVTYTFKVTTSYYESTIYPELLADDFKFILSAKLVGIVEEGE